MSRKLTFSASISVVAMALFAIMAHGPLAMAPANASGAASHLATPPVIGALR